MKSLTDLFIRRPVLAVVVNLIILIAGIQAIRSLTVRQYPRNENAVVTVTTVYVGASADLVRGFVTQPLERAIAALQDVPEDMLIAYGRVNLAKSSGEVVQSIGHPWDATQFRTRGMCIPHQATFHRSTLFRQHGLFDVDSFGTGTYEMLLRYLKNNHAYYFDQIVTVMELGGISTQPKNHLHFLKAYWKAQKKHGTFRVNARLVADAAQAIAKEGLFTLLPPHIACGLVQRARALAGHKAHY